MIESHSVAADLLELAENIVLPMCRIERTITLPTSSPRPENDAEHSFGLALVACSLASRLSDRLDTGLVAEYALVHDLLEIYTGDFSVYDAVGSEPSAAAPQESAMAQLAADFGARYPWLRNKVRGYLERADEESRFVYALDKMIPHAIVLLADRHPLRPTWPEYLRTEEIAREKVRAACPALLPAFEELCEMFAERPHLFRPHEGAVGTEER